MRPLLQYAVTIALHQFLLILGLIAVLAGTPGPRLPTVWIYPAAFFSPLQWAVLTRPAIHAGRDQDRSVDPQEEPER